MKFNHSSRSPRGVALDTLVLRSRMTESARQLLEAMGVEIREVRWTEAAGPPVYRLLAREGQPCLRWMDSARAEDLLDALRAEEQCRYTPDWAHELLRSHRAGVLTGLDGGIDFGETGLQADLVLRDMLRCPTA